MQSLRVRTRKLVLRPSRRLLSSTASSASVSPPASQLSQQSVSVTPITSLLIANRGEIALRIDRTARRLGIQTTTVFTDLDATSQHAAAGHRSLALGSPRAYLDGDRIVDLARRRGIQALHPGYGFLSENAAFARACADAGLVFIGPPPNAMADMGDKARSKEIMTAAGVPCVPGYHGAEQGEQELLAHARGVGFPVLLKSVRGGGGKGMRIVTAEAEFPAQLRSARAEARASFGDGGEVMLVERYVTRPRHVEVQVFADHHGGCVALGERDCSVQRRHQKILEESPAPDLSQELRLDLWDKARRAALAVGYVGAGTVEFILDRDSGEFFFMEMNTRLQVEHPVTEAVTGTDLVEWQLRVAAGEPLPLTQNEIAERIAQRGAAIEARIYAESPERGFMPDSGRLVHLRIPPALAGLASTAEEDRDVRLDAGFVEGDTVGEAYDGMLAKLIVRGSDRETAVRRLHAALGEYEVVGPSTNVEFLKRVCLTRAFTEGDVETGFIEKWRKELFADADAAAAAVDGEVFVQAALAVLGIDSADTASLNNINNNHVDVGSGGGIVGFGRLDDGHSNGVGARTVRLKVNHGGDQEAGPVVEVSIYQTGKQTFSATVTRAEGREPESYGDITVAAASSLPTAPWSPNKTRKTALTTFFPGQRISSTVVQDRPDAAVVAAATAATASAARVTVFQHGSGTQLSVVPPVWVGKVLGAMGTTASASVAAPMPCKILRVEVAVGDAVEKGAPLVVIESMKMETIIRSPQRGVVKKLAHKEGDICKAGTVLVLFEESDLVEDTRG